MPWFSLPVFRHLISSFRSIVDLLTSLHEPAAESLTKSCLFVLDHAVKQTQGNDGNFITKFLSHHLMCLLARCLHPKTLIFRADHRRLVFEIFFC